ncbi:hypothetical protein Tco_1022274 [Tanacetum coccineum]
MFDEFFNPPPSVVSPVPVAAALRPVDPACSPMSTSIDEDAPFTSNPLTQEQEQSPIISQGVEESPKTPHFHDDQLHETLLEDSTSQGSSSNVRPSHTPLDILGKWIIDQSPQESNLRQTPCGVILMSFSLQSRKDELGDVLKHKARLVAKGYRQEEGIDFEESFASCLLGIEPFNSPRVQSIQHSSPGKQAMTFYCPKGIFINQSKYALEIIKTYGMQSSDLVDTPIVDKSKLDEDLQGKPVDTTHYHGMIGSLMYLTSSRPDLVFATMSGVKILDEAHLEVHNSWEINLSDGHPRSKRALLSQVQRLNILLYLGVSAISLYCNNVQHSRSKLIDVRYHFIKEQVENRVVELYFFRMEYQLADIFTKALPRERFNFLINKLGMKSMSVRSCLS